MTVNKPQQRQQAEHKQLGSSASDYGLHCFLGKSRTTGGSRQRHATGSPDTHHRHTVDTVWTFPNITGCRAVT